MAQTPRWIREGLIVGIIGSGAAALFYAAFDILAARGAFFTVDMLGKFLFKGMDDAAILGMPTRPDVMGIVLYSGLHILISLTIGLIVVGLVVHSGRRPSRARTVLAIIVAGFFVTIIAVGVATSPVRTLLPWWSVVVANALAVLIAGAYLLRKNPDTWNRLIPSGT